MAENGVKRKNSFLMFNDYQKHFELLESDKKVKELLFAIFDYNQTGTTKQLDGMVKMAFSFIKTELDRQQQKYISICNRNELNGKNPKRAKASQGKPRKRTKAKKATGLSGSQTEPEEAKKADTDTDTDTDTDIIKKSKPKNKSVFNAREIEIIDKIIKIHPRITKPNVTMANVIAAVWDLVERNHSTASAVEYLLQRTELYRDCVAEWPDKKCVTGSANWFGDACYFEPDESWKREADVKETNLKKFSLTKNKKGV
jgi:uncharacterized protein DUF6291